MFFDSIITQGVKQEIISTTAAARPIHFIYRIIVFAIAVQDTELPVLLQRIESEEYRAETKELVMKKVPAAYSNRDDIILIILFFFYYNLIPTVKLNTRCLLLSSAELLVPLCNLAKPKP